MKVITKMSDVRHNMRLLKVILFLLMACSNFIENTNFLNDFLLTYNKDLIVANV